MEKNIIAKQIKEIEMPKEMQERIIRNCNIRMEEKTMRKNTTKNYFKKPIVAVASLTLCLCLSGVTALATTGKLQGFFKDIINWNGAVTGTSYEQATDEIELHVVNVSDLLTIEMTMVNPNVAPYSTFKLFGIENYKIVDMDGNVLIEGNSTEMAEIADGKVSVNISLDSIASGKYKLIVSELVGSAKADQPLIINGTWACEFTKY